MTNSLTRRSFVRSSAGALMLGGLGIRHAAAQSTALKVMGFPGSSNLSIFAAQHRGLFAKHGLAIELLFTPNSDVLRDGLARGDHQIAHAAVDNAVAMAEIAKADIAIITGGDSGFNRIYVQPEINSYADLRGKTDRDVIAAMLAIADSRFQDELLRRAKDAGKIERDFELPAACRHNTPERIARALEHAREAGLLPPFPFGSDFTASEERLIPALKLLRAAPPLRLARLLARGFLSSAPSREVRECLARMGFAHPSGLLEHVEAALLHATLDAPS